MPVRLGEEVAPPIAFLFCSSYDGVCNSLAVSQHRQEVCLLVAWLFRSIPVGKPVTRCVVRNGTIALAWYVYLG